ncbi:MAG: hypothetical protein EXX96DRAFT_612186 [Benjaminiella poitrasii]|nr:MAG: hypothetical protein EXX96DRAFT_612186 [Benjaminiella poitrasii]
MLRTPYEAIVSKILMLFALVYDTVTMARSLLFDQASRLQFCDDEKMLLKLETEIIRHCQIVLLYPWLVNHFPPSKLSMHKSGRHVHKSSFLRLSNVKSFIQRRSMPSSGLSNSPLQNGSMYRVLSSDSFNPTMSLVNSRSFDEISSSKSFMSALSADCFDIETLNNFD